MSLHDLANAKPATVPALIGQGVLIADIERIKGTAVITKEFWDLKDIQYDRRIRPDDVTAWPRTICAASKWYGEADSVQFVAEWKRGGYQRMMEKLWQRLDQAQIVVGHNWARFDDRKLNAAFLELGWPAPSPYKIVDTLKVAWGVFGFESNTLDALTKRLGITHKSGHYDLEVAKAAVAGDKTKQAELAGYNVGDIHATESLYDYFRPWIKNHPHNRDGSRDKPVCNRCWESNFQRQGVVLANVISYNSLRCAVCGGNLRTTTHHRAASVTGV